MGCLSNLTKSEDYMMLTCQVPGLFGVYQILPGKVTTFLFPYFSWQKQVTKFSFYFGRGASVLFPGEKRIKQFVDTG